MIKKINTQLLQTGMYVHDFNCEWLENPFFHRQLLIADDKMADKVRKAGLKEIYIDTSKGTDVQEGQAKEEVDREIDDAIEKIHDGTTVISIPYKAEMQAARKVKTEAKKIITNIMQDVRMGKQVELEAVDNVVEKMMDSIFRNAGALTTLSRLKSKDEYTFMHSVNVCVLMVAFCKGVGIDREVMKRVGSGALLHDIGKVKVSQDVLNKPGKLTDDEFLQMKNHVVQSKIILSNTPGIYQEAIEVASQHHERFDGTGYPNKLKGDGISQFGQMASIVDVYDAITSDRVYHKGMDSAEALRKLYEWSKFHFRPELVQLFIKTVGIYPVGTVVRLESGLIGVVKEPGVENMLRPLLRVFHDTKKQRYVTPYEMNLAQSGCADKILNAEDPGKWQVNPLELVDMGI